MIVARIDGPLDISGTEDLILRGVVTSTRGSVRHSPAGIQFRGVDARNRCDGNMIHLAGATPPGN
jgi:hypothetical protein